MSAVKKSAPRSRASKAFKTEAPGPTKAEVLALEVQTPEKVDGSAHPVFHYLERKEALKQTSKRTAEDKDLSKLWGLLLDAHERLAAMDELEKRFKEVVTAVGEKSAQQAAGGSQDKLVITALEGQVTALREATVVLEEKLRASEERATNLTNEVDALNDRVSKAPVAEDASFEKRTKDLSARLIEMEFAMKAAQSGFLAAEVRANAADVRAEDAEKEAAAVKEQISLAKEHVATARQHTTIVTTEAEALKRRIEELVEVEPLAKAFAVMEFVNWDETLLMDEVSIMTLGTARDLLGTGVGVGFEEDDLPL